MMLSGITVAVQSNSVTATCLGWGTNYYRTFDGLEFHFQGLCSYEVYSDFTGQQYVIVSNTGCNLYTTCKKVGLTRSSPHALRNVIN